MSVSNSTPVWLGKENATGAASPGSVVLVNVPLTPPTVSTVLVTAAPADAEVWRTQTGVFGASVPEADVNPLLAQILE